MSTVIALVAFSTRGYIPLRTLRVRVYNHLNISFARNYVSVAPSKSPSPILPPGVLAIGTFKPPPFLSSPFSFLFFRRGAEIKV